MNTYLLCLLIITNGVAVFVTEDTNLIAQAKIYPNGIEAPYVLHHPRIDTNHTLHFTYQAQAYKWTFKTEPGTTDTNVVIKTPITTP